MVVAAVVAMLVLPTTSASAQHVDRSLPSFMDWNMCGVVCNNGSLAPADDLANSVLDRYPYYPSGVTVQEICERQWVRLKDRLYPSSASYWSLPTFYYSQQDKPGCGVNGAPGPFGNAVFWRVGYGEYKTGTYWNQDGTNPEKRTIVCGRSTSPAFWTCSTHLINNSSIAQLQSEEAFSFLNLLDDGPYDAFMGADFNLFPNNAYLDRWYNRYWDADGNYRTFGTQYGHWWRYTQYKTANTKPDYLWFTGLTHCIRHDAYIQDVQRSDHHLYQGYHVPLSSGQCMPG
jgi:hypothetical protein